MRERLRNLGFKEDMSPEQGSAWRLIAFLLGIAYLFDALRGFVLTPTV